LNSHEEITVIAIGQLTEFPIDRRLHFSGLLFQESYQQFVPLLTSFDQISDPFKGLLRAEPECLVGIHNNLFEIEQMHLIIIHVGQTAK
jgi:hypothetical protein